MSPPFGSHLKLDVSPDRSRYSGLLCTVKRVVVAAAALFALTACGVNDTTSAPLAAPQTTPAVELATWTPPAGMTAYGSGLAYAWTPLADVDCKSYQDGCYGITVATQNGCPNGIYIELAITDESGAVVDKANDITAGLGKGATAKAVLSPPGGSPTGAKGRLAKLNCLGG